MEMKYCNGDDHLSSAAVAEHDRGKQLAVLSKKIDDEEPTAAAVISAALNRPQTLALKSTELTAVAVLKGEIITQMSMHVGERVAFQTVRERVRDQLDLAADDMDLPEIFGFLITLGVGTNSYIDDLLDFAGKFVNSKFRQLRFSAFGVANAVCAEAPWTKVALIKRTYSKEPKHGYCPNPETHWGTWPWKSIEPLEILLRFAHVTCQPGLEQLPP